MIVEVLTVLAMFVGGSALVRIVGMRGLGLPILGAITGLSLFITVGAVQVVLPITTSPILTISATGGMPIALWVWQLWRGKDVRVKVLPLLVLGAAIVVLIGLFRSLRLANWTFDSIQYLLNGALIANDHFDQASTALVPKRLIGVPLIHAAGNLSGEYYLPSITPLIAGLLVALIAWLGWEALSHRLRTHVAIVVISVCLLLLISMNRFVFHAVYVNGHMLFGLLLLALVGCGWLLTVDGHPNKRVLMLVMVLSATALVFVRAEACIAIALAILPIIVDNTTSQRFKSLLLGAVGAATIAWQGFVMTAYLDEGQRVPFSVFGLLLVGVAMLISILILRFGFVIQRGALTLWGVEIALWLILLVLFLRQPGILIDSVSATLHNALFGEGAWGLSLVMLFALMTIATFRAVPGQVSLRYPLTTFIPFAFLLAYLRDAAYRVGGGDSLNRMWIQLIPLAVLLLIMAVGMGESRRRRQSTAPQALPRSPL